MKTLNTIKEQKNHLQRILAGMNSALIPVGDRLAIVRTFHTRFSIPYLPLSPDTEQTILKFPADVRYCWICETLFVVTGTFQPSICMVCANKIEK